MFLETRSLNMAQSAGLHESEDRLTPATIDLHRALTSLQEEFEAVDWYGQRVDAATDGELAGIMAHNRDEEKEHASMLLEWIRRHDPVLDQHLHTYLFTDGPLLEIEKVAEGSGSDDVDGSLGIGSLKGEAS
jgi:hypothetical protein